jgi:flagellar L-ring protein precursor FlgH
MTLRTLLLLAALGAAARPARLAAQAPATQAPAAQPPAAPTASSAAGALPARPGLRSWVSDRREFAVGDVVTVLVDDYTITSAIKDDQASQRRSRDLDLGVNVNTGGASLPTAISARIGSRNDAAAQNRGEARRENRFQSEMSVRVVAVNPNGTFQVRGARKVDVDKGRQDVTLTGWVRPQDVSTANTVESSRIADAQITYLSPGPLGKPKQGLVTRIVSLVWP